MEDQDKDVITWLNGDEEKENYQDRIKPTMDELLSITDAAVRALDNKSPPKMTGCGKPFGSVQLDSRQLRPLSPNQLMELYGDGELGASPAMPNTEIDRQYRDGSFQSKSSTASDILIRSTVATPRNTNNSAKDAPESGNTSTVSEASLASSGFLTGHAKRVKVSSKKLKEVRSPFENIQPVSKSESAWVEKNHLNTSGPAGVTVSTGDVAPPIIIMNKRNSGGSGPQKRNVNANPKTRNPELDNKSKERPITTDGQEKAKQQYHVERHVTKDEISNIIAKNRIESKDCPSTDESLSNCKEVYRDLHNDFVITDVLGTDQNMYLHESQTSSKKSFDPDMMATTSSKINAEVVSNASSKRGFGFTETGSLFIEDVIAGAMNNSNDTPSLHTSVSEEQNHDPGILTVPESIVTVTAQDKLGVTSGSDASSEGYPYALQDRFGKYRPAGVLQQGAPVDGVDPQKCHPTSDSDVTVTQYGLSDKERNIRNRFVKRQQNSGPIKRVVQPKVIQTNPSVTHTTSSPTTTNSDAITTAAVAASAAVAATQPFLRAQQEVEHRMAEILEKLAVLQGTNPPLSALGSTLGSTVPTEKSAGIGSEPTSTGRVVELEKQLDDLTQRRLDYLEKMHEKQMMVQAKLLSISRQPESSPGGVNENRPSHWPEESRWRPTGVTRVADAQPQLEKYKNYKSPTKLREEREKSVLDTPAPRKKPPTPMAFDGKNKKASSPHRGATRARSKSPVRDKGVAKAKTKPFGLLEELLSGHDDTPLYGPFNQTPPNSLPSARTKSRLEASPSAVEKANDLVHDLKDLKQEMKNALVDAAQLKTKHYDYPSGEKQAAFASFNTSGPFPLDDFLKSAAAVSSSPYPSLRAPPSVGKNGVGPDAPVVQRYSDAEDALQKVQQSRQYLENNLDAILRHHKDAEVLTFLEELTRDSSSAEKIRIKKMVDDHIASMNKELQREITEEMLKLEEAQKRNTSIMVAERDTNSKVKAKPGIKAKGKVGSRIDSGLKKPTPNEPVRKPTYGKPAVSKPTVNKPKVSMPKKPKVTGDKETYLTRVYGKSLYHGMRNTQRDPKVRYPTSSPAAKLARSPPRVAAAKAQQQRGVSEVPPGVQKGNYYFSPSSGRYQQVPTQSGVVTTPVEGHLIPMAIPLRAPRQERGGGGPPGGPQQGTPIPSGSVHSTPPVAGAAPFASTPLENHFTPRPQVSLKDEDSVNPPGAPAQGLPPGPEKQEKALSPIHQPSPRQLQQLQDDYSVSSETATTARQQVAPPQTQPPSSQVADEQLAGYEEDFEEEEDEHTVTESWEEGGIALPGHQPAPAPPYHGPSFPPRAPALTPANSSDVLGSDLRRRDIVANKAMEWLEQELLARLLSEMSEQRALEEAMRKPPPVEPPRPRSPTANSQSSDTSSVIPSEREPLLAEAIGREGLQMFVDAGVAVDDKLVSALVKEVLHEKMTTLTGQMTANTDDGPMRTRSDPGPSTQPPPRPRSRPQSPIKQGTSDNGVPPPQSWKSPVPTPELTPKSSPVVSPRQRVSPPVTPDLTPAGSVAEPVPPTFFQPQHYMPPPPVPDPDTTDESSAPFEEYRPPPMPEVGPEVPSPTFVPRHNVRTPSATPPPSPPPGDTTPELSFQEEIQPSKKKPTREPSPPPAPKEPSPPPSPEPEEEDSTQEEADQEKQVPEQPEWVAPAPAPPPVTIATQTVVRSPSPTTSATQDDSTATETMDGAISEGEWLLTMHSEGEVRPMPLANAGGPRPGDRGRGGGGQRLAVDDTLHDYDDFEFDTDAREQSTDFEPSEGEFLHNGRLPPDQDPMMSYLYQMQNQPMRVLEQQLRFSQMAAAGIHPNQQVDKSLGEISFGQGQRIQSPAGQRPILVQPGRQQQLHLLLPNGQAVQQGQQQLQQQQQQMQQPMAGVRKAPPAMQSASIGEAPSPGNQNISPAASMERAPRLSDARKSGAFGGPILSTENVTRGGRRGGRGAPPRGRPSSGRPQTPDDSQSFGRVIQVRTSQESDLRDTMESIDGLRSTAGSDFRTMTPDQMNTDALLQTGQYLNTTMSTEGGSTTDFGRTGELGTVRSTDVTQSGELRGTDGVNEAHVHSAEFGTKSGEFGTRSGGFGTRSEDFGTGGLNERYQAARYSTEYGENDQEGLMSGTFGRSGRLTYTTTEFEHSGSEYSHRLGETNGSQDLQQTGQYPDSLEGTGVLEQTGSLDESFHYGSGQLMGRQSLQVSVTIPSMAQNESGSEASASVEDVSEISMGN